MSDVARAYDALATDYHALHHDWRASVERHGVALDRLLSGLLGAGSLRILDCSCGIGTQAIGLSLLGHSVVGTDLSPVSLERARTEARSFGVELETHIADMRGLHELAGQAPFDAIISCDNSIAHLGNDELAPAFGEMRALVRAGGAVLASLRDYAPLVAARAPLVSPNLAGVPGERAVTLQLWEWGQDGRSYDATLLFVTEHGGEWDVMAEPLHLNAHLIPAVVASMGAAGLEGVLVYEPEATGFHQPIVAGTRP